MKKCHSWPSLSQAREQLVFLSSHLFHMCCVVYSAVLRGIPGMSFHQLPCDTVSSVHSNPIMGRHCFVSEGVP